MEKKHTPKEYCKPMAKYPFMIHIFESQNIESMEIIPRHWHTNIEMTYRIRYKGRLFINGTEQPLDNDSLVIINSGEIHEIHKFQQKDMFAILISIPFEFIKQIIPDAEIYHFEVGTHEADMKHTIMEMKEEFEADTPLSYIRQYSLAYQLLYYMLADAVPKKYCSIHGHDYDWFEKRTLILDYLEEHIGEIHSVQELSDAFGYSREYFSRIVKQYFGITCQNLILETRLSKAASLLKNTRASVEEIAERTGFPSKRTFVSHFLQYYVEKPQIFRKETLVRKEY